jgi:MFS family permease
MTPRSSRHFLHLIGIFLLGFSASTVLPIFTLDQLPATSTLYPKIMLSVFALQILFEIPSGFVADYLGRWQTLMLGAIFNFLGCVLQADPSMNTFVLSPLLFCASSALYTGAISTYAFELCEKNRTSRHYIKLESFLQASYFLSWLLIAAFASHYPSTFSHDKFFLLLTPALISLPLLIVLPYQSQNEPCFTKKRFVTHIEDCLHTIINHHFLFFVMVITAYTAGVTGCLISLISTAVPYSQLLITLMSTTSFILGALSAPLIFNTHKNLKLTKVTQWLLIINHLTLLFVIVSSIFHAVYPILILMLLSVLSFGYALLISPTMEILNQYSPVSSRATTISISFIYKRSFYCLLILLASSILINALIFSLILLISSLLFLRWFQKQIGQIPQDYPN